VIFAIFVFSWFSRFGVSTFPRFSHFHAFRIFAHFAFSHISRTSHISRFRVFRISHISRLSRISHLTQFAFQIPHVFAHLTNYAHLDVSALFTIRALAYPAHFAFSRILRISHSRVFCASTCATARLPGIHRIPFACPVLILQGPLVRISLCFTRIPSYMSLHSPLCSFISLVVYITSPLYV